MFTTYNLSNGMRFGTENNYQGVSYDLTLRDVYETYNSHNLTWLKAQIIAFQT